MTVLSSSYALTASYALNGGGGGTEGRTAKLDQTLASSTWTFGHNLGEKYPAIEINAKQTQIDNYITRIKHLDEDEKTKISVVYEILSHESFLNKLFVIDKDGKYIPQFLEKNKGRLDYLQNPNGLLIIDEIQNMVSATGTNYRRLLYALRYHTHPKFKVVLLTGTPIYDKPYEFGLLMNLLRPRVQFPDGFDDFNQIFLEK
jgi:hypothetical protein